MTIPMLRSYAWLAFVTSKRMILHIICINEFTYCGCPLWIHILLHNTKVGENALHQIIFAPKSKYTCYTSKCCIFYPDNEFMKEPKLPNSI